MRAYLQFVLRHRLAVLLMIAAMTALAGWSLSRGVIGSSVIKLFFGDNPKYVEYRALADRFGGSDVMVAAYEDEALLTAEGLARLRRISTRAGALPFIRRVDSLDSVALVRAEADDLVLEPYGDAVKTLGVAAVAERARHDPLVSGWLVSEDGAAAAMLLELSPDPDRPIEVIPGMLAEVVEVFHEEGVAKDRLHLAGIVPESSEATAQARFTMLRLFPITVVVLALVVFLLFLRLWPVLITGGVALVSIVWTFGLAIALDPQVNLLMAMVPGMITVIAFSDIIHLYSAFSKMCEGGMTQAEAVLDSGVEVGEACLYTSITTFVGFASLVFIPTPVLRQLGVVLGAGVGIALLLALTLVPIVLSYLPGIEPGMRGESSHTKRFLEGVLAACAGVSTGHPRKVVAVFFVFAAACGYGVSQIEVEASFSQRLSADNPVRAAQDFIADRFAGANFLDLYITAPEDGGLLEPEVFGGIARFQAALEAQPEVDEVLSLINLQDVLHREMKGLSRGQGYRVPESRALIAQYLLLFEVSGGEGLSAMIDDERRTMRLSVRLSTDGLRALSRTGDEAKRLAEGMLPAGVTVQPTGIAYLLGDWVTFILEGQRRGLLFAVLSTALMMVLCLRSWRVGLLSMIPNLLPLLALGGYVGGVWDVVDSDTILVATFAIGIAVDDTIHFLTRLRFESQRCPDHGVALQRTFAFTGRAIVQTTIILCLGFSPFAWSDYFSTRIIGTLLPMTLVMALVADLLLVPALVQLGVLRFGTRKTWQP